MTLAGSAWPRRPAAIVQWDLRHRAWDGLGVWKGVWKGAGGCLGWAGGLEGCRGMPSYLRVPLPRADTLHTLFFVYLLFTWPIEDLCWVQPTSVTGAQALTLITLATASIFPQKFTRGQRGLQIMGLTIKPGDLSWIPMLHIVEGENQFPQTVLWVLPYTHNFKKQNHEKWKFPSPTPDPENVANCF